MPLWCPALTGLLPNSSSIRNVHAGIDKAFRCREFIIPSANERLGVGFAQHEVIGSLAQLNYQLHWLRMDDLDESL